MSLFSHNPPELGIGKVEDKVEEDGVGQLGVTDTIDPVRVPQRRTTLQHEAG